MHNKVSTAPRTLIELLTQRALDQSVRPNFVFLADGENAEITLTYQQLDQQARIIASLLQTLINPGDRVLLLYPPGLEYLPAFFGCLYAGAIAVPTYPPGRNRGFERLASIIAHAKPAVVLTTEAILSKVVTLFPQNPLLGTMQWRATDTLDWNIAPTSQLPEITGDDIAFLQYTSGSTGTPKGVMLTHANLLHNAALVYEACEHTADESYVSWLPTFHDMGFMAGILQPLYGGFPVTLMSPAAFLQRPLRWLQAISRYKATTSGGPNFAYDLCARKISNEERATLDLSTWTVAFNGAEPIRSHTLAQFTSTFAPCGFKPEALYPCYGLAEATLMVTGSYKAKTSVIKNLDAKALEENRIMEANHDNRRMLVSCGRTLMGQTLAVVNPNTLASCAAGEVGEIWVSGPSVAKGYFSRPEETEEVFHASIAGTTGPDFLRTGDLGFIDNGELFITGRLKDLVIIRGRNHYPQDLELTVERCHPALRPGCGAAFSTDIDGEERLVIVQEVDRRKDLDLDAVVEKMRAATANEHEVELYAVVLIELGTIAKTTSGKIQRHACRGAFLKDKLQTVYEWRNTENSHPSDAVPSLERVVTVQDWLREQLAARLGMKASQISLDRPFAEYGLDSVATIELAHLIETRLGIRLSLSDFFEQSSLAELAAEAVRKSLSEVAVSQEAKAAPGDEQISHGQKAIWFLQTLAPESTAYNIASAVRIRSELDVEALRRSFQAVVDRHASLRTTFELRDGEPVQRVWTHTEANFDEVDASEWTAEYLKQQLEQAAQYSFNLAEGPLHRIRLYKRRDGDHVLLLVMHHIVTDFWSLAVLIREVGAFYHANISNSRASLPELSIDYAGYVEWQQQMLAGDEGQNHWRYWQEQLALAPAMLALPTDRPRPPVQTFAGTSLSFKLDEKLTHDLKALGQQCGATLYMTLLAAFQTLLYHYTGQKEIVVGSPMAGRNQAAFAGLIGYFINPVALRATLSDELTFANLLHSVRKTVLEAFEHQDYPFNLLVEHLRLPRDASRTPLFQVMFAFQNMGLFGPDDKLSAFALQQTGAQAEFNGLALECIGLDHRIAQFDLTLIMAEADNRLVGRIEYNTDLFAAETLSRLAGHFQTLLRAVVNDPALPIAQAPILSPAEQQQLLIEWNDTNSKSSLNRCIHELFESQVRLTPDATALVFEDAELSYQELNTRANQLAHYLRKLGVGPEVPVGVLLPRSVEMIVSLLAVLKAGGAYVPLDPAYPVEGFGYMLANSQAAVLIAQQSIGLNEGVRILRLDEEQSAFSHESRQDLVDVATPDNLAYVIYTSGSTGLPKGVGIAHQSTVALIEWSRQLFEPKDLAGTLASTSICFDLSVFEIFVPLSCGGTVILAEDVLQLHTLPAARRITLINTVPSAMAELLNIRAVPTSVRVVNLAGEQLQEALVQSLYQAKDVQRVVNLYGPTEDTTYSTWASLGRTPTGLVPIGRPIANSQAYVLNQQMQPVPIGVAGEIYLGGAGLARGYLGRPDLTAERFVPHPFAPEAGARLYRTGDRGRYLPDGSIQYLGRNDRQIKLRGYRIELSEIETLLSEHPSIDHAVVAAKETGAGEKRIVAYVVPKQPQGLTSNEIRNYVKDKLPGFMIPAAVVLLDALPLTPNGKVDHMALPMPAASGSRDEREFVAPHTATEKSLAGIWTQLLNIERVSANDDFFEMGGHSLLAVRLISRVRETSGVELQIRDIFLHPTLVALAAHVDEVKATGFDLPVPTIRPVSRDAYRKPLSAVMETS